MGAFFSDDEYAALEALVEELVPGAASAGVADYIDTLLGAFTFDPPRIWAGGPFSGRHGGDAGFEQWIPLSPVDELAWRTRIEGSRGDPDREWNGPVVGWQELYRAGLAPGAERPPEFTRLVYEHACEGMYGDPVYGGNRDLAGWDAIGWVGDVQPRGYTDDEVSQREKTPVLPVKIGSMARKSPAERRGPVG